MSLASISFSHVPVTLTCLILIGFSGSQANQDEYRPPVFEFPLTSAGCVTDFDSGVDYYPIKSWAVREGDTQQAAQSVVTFSQDFSIEYHPLYKVITNLRHQPPKVYLVYRCGMLPPVGTGIPNIHGVFAAPPSSWSTGLTVSVGFLDLLGIDVLNKATVVDMRRVTSPCLQKLAEETVECSDLQSISSSPRDIFIATVKNNSAIHFTDFFETAATEGDLDVSIDATTELGPLRRAEWVKFVAAFFNKEPEANHVFAQIAADYHQLQGKVSQAIGDGLARPVAVFATYWCWNGFCSWEFSGASYKTNFLYDAGAENYQAGHDWKLTFANASEAKAALRSVDIVIDESHMVTNGDGKANFMTNFELTESDANSGNFPFLTNNAIFRKDKRQSDNSQSLDWFESAVARPDLVLKDLVAIIHPSLLPEHTTSRYFRNAAALNFDLIGASSCAVATGSLCSESSDGDAASQGSKRCGEASGAMLASLCLFLLSQFNVL